MASWPPTSAITPRAWRPCLEPAVVTLATIYVMAWGYLHLMGKIDEPILTGLKRIAWWL